MYTNGDASSGQYEFVKKGDPPVMGVTKVGENLTLEHIMRPRMPPLISSSLDSTADCLPASDTR